MAPLQPDNGTLISLRCRELEQLHSASLVLYNTKAPLVAMA
jgi:hypothetical protein